MSSVATATPQLAPQWQKARLLHALFVATAKKANVNLAACTELDSGTDSGAPQLQNALNWLRAADAQLPIPELRQLLQSTNLGADDQLLAALLAFYNIVPQKDASVRAKLEFVAVQYFAHFAPASLDEVSFASVAAALQPIIGAVQPDSEISRQCDSGIAHLLQAKSLKDLVSNGILDKARSWKESVAARGTSAGLVQITRLNFHLRTVFIRLLHREVNLIRILIGKLEEKGIATVDCASAQLQGAQKLEDLKVLCNRWMSPFRRAYDQGHSFSELILVRQACEKALAA